MSFLNQDTTEKLFAVAGYPILHSKSPQIFNSLFAADPELKDKAFYSRISALLPEDVKFLIDEIGITGINLTMPHKKAMLKFVDMENELVQKINAANIIKKQNKEWIAFNSDHYGAYMALKKHTELEGKKVLILGAGNSARSAAALIVGTVARVTFINRTKEKSAEAATTLGAEYVEYCDLEKSIAEADILINTLPFNAKIVRKEWLRKEHIILDAIYNNPYLDKFAAEVGCSYIPGEEWLAHQAQKAYEIFIDSEADMNIIDREIKKKSTFNKSKMKIAFIGLMGSGKTTIGKMFARLSAMGFFDTDDIIIEQEKTSIAEYFATKGEAAFRKKENEVLRSLLKQFNSGDRSMVVACGGGIVVSPENRELLKEFDLVIWLFATAEECSKRIFGTVRPPIGAENLKSSLENLLIARKSKYLRCADIIISSHYDIMAVVDQIKYEIKNV